jgi:hypothetical protein
MPGAAAGTVIFQKIRPSLMPRVRPALIRSTLTCSKAARAFRYIRGKEITEAATIQPSQVCTSLMLKVPYSQLPSGLRREKSSSRKKPATVGAGHGQGEEPVNQRPGFRLGPHNAPAAQMPRKKQITVATAPVFREIHRGRQSSCLNICQIASIDVFSFFRQSNAIILHREGDEKKPEAFLPRTAGEGRPG